MKFKDLNRKKILKITGIAALIGVAGIGGMCLYKYIDEPKPTVPHVAMKSPHKKTKSEFEESIAQTTIKLEKNGQLKKNSKQETVNEQLKKSENDKKQLSDNKNVVSEDKNQQNYNEDDLEKRFEERKPMQIVINSSEKKNLLKASKMYYEFLSERNDLQNYGIFQQFCKNYENYHKYDTESNYLLLLESTQAVEISLSNIFK